MLQDEIKKRVVQAMKVKDAATRDVLKVALGELQLNEARAGRALSPEQEQQTIRKMVKSARETIDATDDPALTSKLETEIELLDSLLPQTLSVDEIVAALEAIKGPITDAANDGQATGVAMKHLKAGDASVDGKDVAAAVRQMRQD